MLDSDTVAVAAADTVAVPGSNAVVFVGFDRVVDSNSDFDQLIVEGYDFVMEKSAAHVLGWLYARTPLFYEFPS